MSPSSSFARLLFVLLSLLFMIALAVKSVATPTLWTYTWGSLVGLGIGGALLCSDYLFKRFNLRIFNITALGLFFGYLMGMTLTLIFNTILELSGTSSPNIFIDIVKIALFLFALYLGVMMTLRASDEISVSLPFVKLIPTAQQTKDLLLDLSALSDPRIIDLAACGLLDKRLVLPRFLLKELHQQEEDPDETNASRAKRSLDVVKKLEMVPGLHLRYQDTDFPDAKELTSKVLRLARLLDADVLSADINRVQMAQIEGIRIINIHTLSNALKRLMQRGEFLKIKIQRHGKEERQGVGYLEDGTMVVVNGGGDYVGGGMVTALVLSVKHTSSGRMIFCNMAEDKEQVYAEEHYS